MHFASRLGLDQQSVRGIPEKRDDGFAWLLVENDRLRARVAELEAALKQARVELALSASATVPSASATVTPSASASATPARKNKTASTVIAAKPTVDDGPWIALGISRRTYYRRKSAGVI